MSSPRYMAEFVKSFPTPLEPSVLYVSLSYSTAAHICPCGCGREVVTKLSPARYRFIYDGQASLHPSIASTGLPCNSHYFITRGEVRWSRPLSPPQAARARAADQKALDDHRASETQPGRLRRLWMRLSGRW
jgi:hypothetical protein